MTRFSCCRYEALAMILMYVVYLLVLAINTPLERWSTKLVTMCQTSCSACCCSGSQEGEETSLMKTSSVSKNATFTESSPSTYDSKTNEKEKMEMSGTSNPDPVSQQESQG